MDSEHPPIPPSADEDGIPAILKTPFNDVTGRREPPYDLYDGEDADDPPMPPDLTSLSIPAFPAFTRVRHGIAAEAVQAWYHDCVVPKYQEVLEQTKALQAQRLREQEAAQRHIQSLRDQVNGLAEERNALHDVLEREAVPDTESQIQQALREARWQASEIVADAEAEMTLRRAEAERAMDNLRAQVERTARAQLGELYTTWRDFHAAKAALAAWADTHTPALAAAVAALQAATHDLAEALRPPAPAEPLAMDPIAPAADIPPWAQAPATPKAPSPPDASPTDASA
jgi:hypothetical protein